jgi:hypothetical protein
MIVFINHPPLKLFGNLPNYSLITNPNQIIYIPKATLYNLSLALNISNLIIFSLEF